MPDIRTLVLDLCARAGLDPERDVDAARLHGRLDGMVLDARQPARAGLEALLTAFRLDAVESDGRLCFRPRGAAPVATVAVDEVLAPGGDEAALTVTRTPDAELPGQVDVLYRARAADWQRAVQTARRAAQAGRAPRTVALPLALSDARARALADMLLFEAWAGRERLRFRLPADYAWLEPGDGIVLEDGPRRRALRLIGTESDLLGLLCEAVSDDAAVLEARPAAAAPHVAGQALAGLAETELFLLDLPPLRDEDGDGGFYAAASWTRAEGRRWPGAGLYRSDDGSGGAYHLLGAVPGPAVWGRCVEALPPGPTAYWDEAARLRVVLRQGELESAAAPAVLAGANAALVGAEIVQFRNAVLVAEATYELSGLLRGRRGSEAAVAGHAAEETFLLLRPYDLMRVARGGDLIGLPRHYKAPTHGRPLDEAPAMAFTNTGRGLRPLAPAHVRGERDSASGDWSIAWVRRARVGGAWRDGGDVPLDEAAERYEVDILHSRHPIVGASGGEARFDIAGDHRAAFPPGAAVTVTGSTTGNDGTYTIDAADYLVTSGKTRLFTVAPPVADGGGGDLTRSPRVARTLTVSGPALVYTAAQQQDDFGAQRSILDVRVCQLGALGRGQATETSLT